MGTMCDAMPARLPARGRGAMPAKLAARAVTLLAACGFGLLPAARAEQACVPVSGSDWMVSSDPLAAPIRPADCAWTTQTPPDFGWPDLSSDASYQVTLTYPDGRVRTVAAAQNWVNWPETLPAGNYAWQVQVSNSSGIRSSLTRHFTVDTAASPFLLPDAATLYNRVIARAHPRGLPDATTLASMASQRQSGISILLAEADSKLGVAPQSDPNYGSVGSNWAAARDESRRTTNAALAYVFTKQTKYLTDAVIRLKNLASWNPYGTTSYTVPGMDMGARQLDYTIAMVYDWLAPQLDSATRSLVLSSLKARTTMIINDVIGTRSTMAIHPLDSHRNMALMSLAGISVILAGDLPEAQNWLAATVPLTANLVSPWGDPDSGHANGTAQGSWDMSESLLPWYVLRWGAGIDIAQKPWMKNWSRFIAYFIPPGTPAGNFGDGAESVLTENWARFGKAATWFAPTPLGRWYASQLKGEDPSRLEYLLAPPADYTSAAFPSGTASSAVFRGIGWAALHSDLSNPARTSVYFKSSPYGSFNHSHGDQNSFVVNAGGQRLAIDSGYYDDYKTPHWLQWYKQSRAHNTITYDGGLGQTIYEISGKIGRGALTGYVRGSDYDIVYGDATPAYDGALQKAQRALVYLSPNYILVYDNLASATARQWEWNLHAVNQMQSASGTAAVIQNGGQSLCVNVLGGPATAFRQSNAFTANPIGSWSAQWHGMFYSTSKLAAAEFVTLLNVGCVSEATPPSASKSGSVWTVKVGNRTVSIDNGAVSVGGTTTATSGTGTTGSGTVTATTTPWGGTPVSVPATLEAENFDLGGEGIGYHDTSKGNSGGQYRTSEDVDIVASCDTAGGGYVINNFTTGEWLAYTINVPTSGKYDIALRLASNYATGAFHAEIDGVNVTGAVTPVKTGGWCAFQWFGRSGIPLTAGKHVLKVFADQQYFNLNAIRITATP